MSGLSPLLTMVPMCTPALLLDEPGRHHGVVGWEVDALAQTHADARHQQQREYGRGWHRQAVADDPQTHADDEDGLAAVAQLSARGWGRDRSRW